jgi:hypothetical protein
MVTSRQKPATLRYSKVIITGEKARKSILISSEQLRSFLMFLSSSLWEFLPTYLEVRYYIYIVQLNSQYKAGTMLKNLIAMSSSAVLLASCGMHAKVSAEYLASA